MPPLVRTLVIVALGSLFAIWIGTGIAQEEYLLAVAATALSVWVFLAWRGGAHPEAWILAVTLFGYVIGNRGFAQFSLTARLPLLPAEAALLVVLVAVAFRMARREVSVVQWDALNAAIILWMLLGAARLWDDIKTYGPIALRDFATIYYALFFFFGQALARHPPSLQLIRRAILAACALLPVSYLLYDRFTPWFHRFLSLRGAPLIYYKDDLVAAYLAAGVFLLWLPSRLPPAVRILAATAAFASIFTIDSSRAAIAGLVVASAWWAFARRWAPLRFQLALATAGVLLLIAVALASRQEFERSRAYALYEHVASIVDVTGTRRYTSAERMHVGDNNRFRLSWWENVAVETWENAPVFGLGFGANLSERFLRNYDIDLGEDFSTRSPHSIVFTVLGRMGAVGLAAFLAIVAAMTVHTARLCTRVRHDDAALVPLGWWTVAWILFVSACFGVVLEGPMGALVFWTALGFANAATTALARSIADPSNSIVQPAVPATR